VFNRGHDNDNPGSLYGTPLVLEWPRLSHSETLDGYNGTLSLVEQPDKTMNPGDGKSTQITFRKNHGGLLEDSRFDLDGTVKLLLPMNLSTKFGLEILPCAKTFNEASVGILAVAETLKSGPVHPTPRSPTVPRLCLMFYNATSADEIRIVKQLEKLYSDPLNQSTQWQLRTVPLYEAGPVKSGQTDELLIKHLICTGPDDYDGFIIGDELVAHKWVEVSASFPRPEHLFRWSHLQPDMRNIFEVFRGEYPNRPCILYCENSCS
jgi:hypothetical protein